MPLLGGLRHRAGEVSAALRHLVPRSGDRIAMAAAVPVAMAAASVEVAVASMAAAMEVADTVKKKHLIRPPQSKQ